MAQERELTEQYLTILKMYALGIPQPKIADELGISRKTVAHYLNRIKATLRRKGRASLVAYALENGLLVNEAKPTKKRKR